MTGLDWMHLSDGVGIYVYLDCFWTLPRNTDLTEGFRRGAWFSVLTKQS